MKRRDVATPIATTAKTAAWLDKNMRPVIASLAGQGHLGAVESLELLDGLDGLVALVKFFERYGDAIKRAAQ